MKTFFKGLFDYSHHYNLEFIKEFSAIPEQNDRSVKLFSHILNAHHVWNSRMRQLPADYGVWDIHAVAAFRNIAEQNYAATIQIIDDLSLDMIIDYRNSKGEPFRNSVQDILFHVINHSTYHRGQIAMLSRQNGSEPVASDYIFYRR